MLAGAVRLLDVGFFRIGSEDYAERNGSYGLTTLLQAPRRASQRDALMFDFPAKSGQRRRQACRRRCARLVAGLKRRRGGDRAARVPARAPLGRA